MIGTTTTAISMKSRKKAEEEDYRHDQGEFRQEAAGQAVQEFAHKILAAKGPEGRRSASRRRSG